jgi:hypothetical protein
LLINPIMQVRFDIYMEQGTSIFGRIRQLILLIIFPMLMIYINDNLLNKHNPVYGKFYMVYFFVASISIGNTDIGFRLLNYLMLLRISFFVLFTYNVLTSLCFRPVSIPLFIILVIMPISMEYLIYISDTSHIQHNTKRYFRWYPYTTVFYKNNKYQQKITNNRELYIDNVEEYQHDYYK